MSNNRTTIKDSVDDFIRLARRGLRISEGSNPSISCGYSRPHEPEHEAHAPTGMTDPFVRRPEKEMVDISAPIDYPAKSEVSSLSATAKLDAVKVKTDVVKAAVDAHTDVVNDVHTSIDELAKKL